ncbi:AraC family transcriptional regulator [Butyrivibrio sp. INlla21]|uniref:AraC family transcriptional regulator n=1 Tax=Butyrivibrio sp. INlla21 TaxID=1520811 RepID=UPI0008E6DF99|nr:AraC family transcriptional regulator [Butyrivibrio sp. INlla21]SFU42771.1 AraC-type DNA-binding protein [Butyrivibrio sp. INlla21]
MNEKGRKLYQAMGSDLVCEVKTITDPLDETDDMHNHTCHEILIIKKGRLSLFTDNSGIEMERGDVALVPKYRFHRGKLSTPGIYDRIVINVSENIIDDASTSEYSLNNCFKPYNDKKIHSFHLEEEELEEIDLLSRKLQDNLFNNSPESVILAMSYLKIIMVMLNKKYKHNDITISQDKMPDIVKRTFNYIDKHLTDDISLKILEKEIHSNGTYISRCVKKISGLSISQYVIAKRIALACKHLREGSTAYEACFKSGFNNYSNFSRTFTKQVGVSPKQYQLEYRKGIIANI